MANLKDGSTIKKGSTDELIATVNDITRMMPDNIGVTRGSDANGSWLRFDNGVQVCWNSQNHGTKNFSVAWGSVFGIVISSVSNYPQPFKSAPLCFKQVTSSNASIIQGTVNPHTSTTNSGTYECFRATTATAENVTTHYVAIGMWK